jgi:RNA polymerase sigma factor (sigma-70 family)
MDMFKETLVLQYMPLAKKLAAQRKKGLPKFVDLEDLISAAYLGLCEAASRFDTSKNVSFSTFAYFRINGAIYDYLRGQGWGAGNRCDVDVDTQPGFEETNHNEMLEIVSQGLGDQAQSVLRYYFVDQFSMKEVGEKIGVSESRVSQIVKGCKDHIRRRYNEVELCELLAA